MKQKIPAGILFILFSLVFFTPSFCLDGDEIIRLTKAGISDRAIQLMMREKIVETCAFTVEEIIDLGTAGLSDKTIRMLITEGSFIKDMKPMVYGKDIRSIKFTTAKDIIELKEAGISDRTIQTIIVFGSRNSNDIEKDNALEMLNNMGIMLDLRKGGR